MEVTRNTSTTYTFTLNVKQNYLDIWYKSVHYMSISECLAMSVLTLVNTCSGQPFCEGGDRNTHCWGEHSNQTSELGSSFSEDSQPTNQQDKQPRYHPTR
ncbi:hypothetical protein BsWGS_05829 [Bradybaena similaris]